MNVNGFPLRCPHCGGASFQQQQARYITTGLDILSPLVAQVFECRKCRRLEWFLEARTNPENHVSPPRDCSRCGTYIPATEASCPNCGELK
jgi:hypothetical protein